MRKLASRFSHSSAKLHPKGGILTANEVDQLTHYEIRRLLDRSIDAIRDMREQTGTSETHRARDVLIDFRISSERARDLSAEEVRDMHFDGVAATAPMQHTPIRANHSGNSISAIKGR